MNKTIFHIPKMDCAAEEQLIRMKLDGEPAIKKLDFNLQLRKLEVYHDGGAQDVDSKLRQLNLGSKLVETVAQDTETFDDDEPLPADTAAERRLLWLVLAINFGSFVVEIIAGIIARSMGLVADSLDMLADAIVYALSLYAVGRAISSKKRIAGISGYLQLALAAFGLIEVFRRLAGHEQAPNFGLMIIISLIALAGNSASLYLLQKAKSKEAHIQASWIFTSNDVIVNIGVIVAGVSVYFTHSKVPDLVVGAIVFIIVGRGAFRILKLSK